MKEILLKITNKEYEEYFGYISSLTYSDKFKMDIIKYALLNESEYGTIKGNIKSFLSEYQFEARKRIGESYNKDTETLSVYIDNNDEYDDTFIEEQTMQLIRNIYIISNVVKTPDYFTNREEFEQLETEIYDMIDEYEYDITLYEKYKIIEQFNKGEL